MTNLKHLKAYYLANVNPERSWQKEEFQKLFEAWLDELSNFEIYESLDSLGI